MSKDTEEMKNSKEITYEAILNNVLFEWPSTSIENKEEAEQALKEWLNQYTNGYTLSSFYLKENKE